MEWGSVVNNNRLQSKLGNFSSNGTYIESYNKRNAHFEVQELLLQFWTERHKKWQEYGEALGA